LGTLVIQFLQDATILTFAVPSGAAGRAATPFTGVTIDGAIINVKIGLAIVVVKAVATGAAVEANELAVGVADRKLALVANAKGVGVGVVAFVRGGVENIKDTGRGLYGIRERVRERGGIMKVRNAKCAIYKYTRKTASRKQTTKEQRTTDTTESASNMRRITEPKDCIVSLYRLLGAMATATVL